MLLALTHPYPFTFPKPSSRSSPPFLPSRVQTPKHLRTPLLAALSNPETATTTKERLAKSAIHRIAEKLRSLGYLEDSGSSGPSSTDASLTGFGSPGEIFIPNPKELPKHRVGHTIDSSWSTPDQPVPEPGAGIATNYGFWKDRMKPRASAVEAPSVAELTLPAGELKRLRSEGIRLERRIKIGKAGVTEGIVNGIHERWRRSELVKIKCEDLCRMNMKRTHEILERKTGGLVIWRSGTIIILYRGANYKYPYFSAEEGEKANPDELLLEHLKSDESPHKAEDSNQLSAVFSSLSGELRSSARRSLVLGVGSSNRVRLQLPGEVQLEEEADRLLDGLGPRFTDWWGCNPLPVDADLLPAIVTGFKKPFRLLPFGVQPKLTDREMTILRRLGRPIPCHFALGRNRNLQGLAVSMIKLWEKCEIAKIAIKKGVQNTSCEIMSEELKHLTGGTLLSRNKEFIVFYRGKDFLPPAASIAIEERRSNVIRKQKLSANENSPSATASSFVPKPAETHNCDEIQESHLWKRSSGKEKISNLAAKSVEVKLSETLKKKERAEEFLKELEKAVEPKMAETDKEAISEEERYMLRKVGLRMKQFLLLGRRGVFDGTVENMHLHWKYRELVKIISNDRCIENVESVARTLEAESGGILVAVERVSKGHAIVVYRGKNYRRPAILRPQTLLNKRAAMKRSIEAQRHESLKLHVLSLSRNIDELKQKMDVMQSPKHELSSSTTVVREQSRATERGQINCIKSAQHQENFEVDMLSSVKENWHPSKEVMLSLSEPELDKHTNEEERTSDESRFLPTTYMPQACASSSTTTDIAHVPAKESKDITFKASELVHESPIDEDKLDVKSEIKVPFKAAPLSNRERLILRKEALRMRKRPVLAVGRNNSVTGVAKTIMTHFQKHHLAIVNIKGRAKGTSVQEVIFQLEQATGAVLVSREPNKVILYRGWGPGDSPGGVKEQNARMETTVDKAIVSPQLIAAIRLECGLQSC